MKISDIRCNQKVDISAYVTFMVSSNAKRDLYTIAAAKGLTISELVREVIDDFLTNNAKEIEALSGETA